MTSDEINSLTARKHAILREAAAHGLDESRAKELFVELESIEERLAALTAQALRERQAAGVSDSPLLLPPFLKAGKRGRPVHWKRVSDTLYRHATLKRYKVFLDGEWLTAS